MKQNRVDTISQKKWYQHLASWANSWPGVIILGLSFMMFIAAIFVIPSGSMIKTLLVGDVLAVTKYSYGTPTPHLPQFELALIPGTDLIKNPASGHILNGATPNRGDIIVFRYPPNPKLHYVKRCVALPGDKLFVQDKDLYLRPAEGDTYIKSHYHREDLITLKGQLWVKNPYMRYHKGIWHDASLTQDSQVIPLGTFIVTNPVTKQRDFIRIENNDIWVHFPYVTKEELRTRYSSLEQMHYYDKQWIKNPDAYPFSVKDLTKDRDDSNIELEYASYNAMMNEEIFNFASLEQPHLVTQKNYFMMGDNRDHSNDSRSWGMVHYGLLEGTPLFVIISFAEDFSIRWDRCFKNMTELEEMLP